MLRPFKIRETQTQTAEAVSTFRSSSVGLDLSSLPRLHLIYFLLHVVQAVKNPIVAIIETHEKSVGAIASSDDL
jgi:hypothetical protein